MVCLGCSVYKKRAVSMLWAMTQLYMNSIYGLAYEVGDGAVNILARFTFFAEPDDQDDSAYEGYKA